MEIGSEFYFEEEFMTERKDFFFRTINAYHSASSKNITFCGAGRSALRIVVDSIIAQNSQVNSVLLPAFLCDSIIKPFEDRNIKCNFYKVDFDGNVDFKAIDKHLTSSCIFYFIDFFGFVNTQLLERISELKKTREFIIINDITHSIFTKKNIDFKSDFYIASLRKWLGVPSGGLVINCSNYVLKNSIMSNNYEFSRIRLEAMKNKKSYIKGFINEKQVFLSQFNKGEEILNNFSEVFPLDMISSKILSCYNYDKMIYQRQCNYNVLLDGLSNIPNFSILNNKLDNNVCPLFFVIKTNKRNDLQTYLAKQKIYAPIHWPKPESIIKKRININDTEYQELLSIPCDQRYTESNMLDVIKEIKGWCNLNDRKGNY
ncbi:hypothetical protein [Enterococcus gallinarum]|uniref:hypothetical protein n=1 Tax=Enterococcus gallinarum TaxID=1353 RepID=UPI00288EEFA7|nr:hypothetical protein [Enterococcus gallinarum]MDT2719650.1 hypothetical protein [Enterococcus gallinarum]